MEEKITEYKLYIQSEYDSLLELTEGRGISYGEIAYIDSLSLEKLQDLEMEIENELYMLKELNKNNEELDKED